MATPLFDWQRFWCPRSSSFVLTDGGFLLDPDSEYGLRCNPHVVPFKQISEEPCLVLLGEPGIGKTVALERHRAAIEAPARGEGDVFLWHNLNAYQSDMLLVRSIFEHPTFTAWTSGGGTMHLFLDSLDECLIRLDTLANLLVQELGRCPVERLRLRLACRTAVWPGLLEEGLRRLWGKDAVAVYELAPLRKTDTAEAAVASGLDPVAFLEEVNCREAAPLASKPVTLRFLLSAYKREGGFAPSQVELYRQGCGCLCEEGNESRRVSRRVGALSPRQRLAVAARLAALSIFCGRPSLWTGTAAETPEAALSLQDLVGGKEEIDGQTVDITEAVIREVLDTGLFSAWGPETLWFAHQTYAEFLAAWYLHSRGLDVAQMLSLITRPGDEGGRVVPQLQEAAAWLASLAPPIYDRIAQTDPQVLLGSDVTAMSAPARERLVASLLRLFDAGTLADSQWDLRAKYRKLAHPRLDTQLEPYIRDRGKNTIVRRVAIDVAEACELRSLQQLLADIALEPAEDQYIREQAAAALKRIADLETKRRLRPCVSGQAGEDPQDELKGLALLALWPEDLTAEELFAALTPPKDCSFFGSYTAFLSGPFLQGLTASALPVALRWAAEQSAWDDVEAPFGRQVAQLLMAAWDHLGDVEVLAAFAQVVTRGLADNRPIPGLERVGERAIPDAQRLHLAEVVAPLLLEFGGNPAGCVYAQTPLLLPRDLPWLIERVGTASPSALQVFWIGALGAAFQTGNPGHVDALLAAMPICPALEQEFGALFGPIEIDSPQAEAMRQEHRRWQEWQERRLERERPMSPPLHERIAICLRAAEDGNLNAWWQLNRQLTLEPASTHYGDELVSDLTTLPVWKAADIETRQRIIEAGRQYLLRAQPSPDEWLGTNIFHRRDFAGYRALRLLEREQPDAVETLPADRWRAWAAVIVGYPTVSGGPEEEPHHEFVRRAYAHAPEEVIRALLARIDQENRDDENITVHRKVELCWDGRLAGTLTQKVQDLTLKPGCMGRLLESLLPRGIPEARAFAASLLTAPVPGEATARQRAVVAATMLLVHDQNEGWDTVWPALQADADFGREVLTAVAERPDQSHAGLMTGHLSEGQIGDLYCWLVRHFPPSEDPQHKGAYWVGPRESVALFRDSVLGQLQSRGTPAACRAMERLAAALPQFSWLHWAVVRTRAHTLRQTWVPPKPEVLLRLTQDRDLRLVESGEQLLAVVMESLRRLEQELQGENPAAPDLWNKLGDGMYRPKEENDLSDYVVRHLRRDVKQRGIVANREVEIRRGEGNAQGERTDILIDAVAPGRCPKEYDRVSVIVEVKGCWNQRLKSDMKGQLRDRYLAENPCQHGLYLVGWFACPQWDAGDGRSKRTPKMPLEKARRFFDDQATPLCQGELRIRAFVLNAVLR